MKQFQHTVTIPGGIHARTTGQLTTLAAGYSCAVTVLCGSAKANMRRPFELLAMGVQQGQTITVQAEGDDEAECIAALQQLFADTV